jgi:hypothetical protein
VVRERDRLLPDPGAVVRVSVWPTCAVPETDGGAVFRGGPATEAAWTTPVAFDVADEEPSEFAAVTRKRMRWPTSACRTV